MRVRRKSEIAEAVRKYGMWDVEGEAYYLTPEEFAAHYEPVPAQQLPMMQSQTGWVHMMTAQCQEDGCLPAAPSVSEERTSIPAQPGRVSTSISELSEDQPAQVNVKEFWSKGVHKMKVGDGEWQDVTAAPHRATITMIPCEMSNRNCWHIEIDGVRPSGELGWCGTEAEAKAKLESLSK